MKYSHEEICAQIRKNRPNFLAINGPYIVRYLKDVKDSFMGEGDIVILDIRDANVLAIFPITMEKEAKATVNGMNMSWILTQQEKDNSFEFVAEIPVPFQRAVLYNFAKPM
jgi:ribosomal protein L5